MQQIADTLAHPVTQTGLGTLATGIATAPPTLTPTQTIVHYAISGLLALASQIILKLLFNKNSKTNDENSVNNQNQIN